MSFIREDGMRKLWFLLFALGMFGALARPAGALIVTGDGRFYAKAGENVLVSFSGASADNTDRLYLDTGVRRLLFDSTLSAPGTIADLGLFNEKTELVFELENAMTGDWFFGKAALNADGQSHLRVTDLGGGLWQLGWEDLVGGDFDFNDVVITVRNGVVPEPGVLILVGLGLSGLAGLMRRRARLR